MFIIHLDSQAEMQLLVLEKIWERYSAPKFEQKATPVAGKLDCYWALNERLYLKWKQQFLSQPFVTLSFCDWKIG